jgi:signal transduction histidine kinase
VEDSGIGIAEEELAHLFQMFQRMNNAREYEGTGLGLAIVRRAVERMAERWASSLRLAVAAGFGWS